MSLDTRNSVILSVPLQENLSEGQRTFLDAVIVLLNESRLRIVPDSAPTDDFEQRFRTLTNAQGVLVVAFSQWEARRLYRDQKKPATLPTENVHIQSAFGVAAHKPVLVLREKALAERGALRMGHLPHVVKLPTSLRLEWLERDEFRSSFNNWLAKVECARHVFLGYSSKATEVADKLFKFLTDSMALRVFDWHEFRPGDTIWDSIERSERSTTCGIFLFMADDRIGDEPVAQFAPRDNVVYEAGYFAGAKGRKQAIIIREEGAKIPTDLGGLLHITLADRSDTLPIEDRLREAVTRRLNPAPGDD